MLKTNLDVIQPDFTEFKLPSGGVFYRKEFPDFPATAQIRAFSFVTEAVLATNLSIQEKMARATKDVVLNFPAGFNVDQLLEADQMVIMALARGQTYGEVYTFATICPACGMRETHDMKIPEQLPVKNWAYNTYEEMLAGSEIKLPVSGDLLRIRHRTVGYAKQREVEVKVDVEVPESDKPKKKSGGSAIVKATVAPPQPSALDDLPKDAIEHLNMMARNVEMVNGTSADTQLEMVQYLVRLPGRDRVAFGDFLDKAACGIDYNVAVKCDGDKCGNQFTAFLPITGAFFRRGQ